MSKKSTSYKFRGKIWKYKGPGGWYFITLPVRLSQKIRKEQGRDEEGWGRLKTVARVGKSEWPTAIWFDSKARGYLLPLKALIRKAEKIEAGTQVTVQLIFESSDLGAGAPRIKPFYG